MIRRLPWVAAVALLLSYASAARALDDQTKIWVEARSGFAFFNKTDPNALENLATRLSSDRSSTPYFSTINFDDKSWEIPINFKLGLRMDESFNLWGFYERLPYVLEGPLPKSDGTSLTPPNDSVRLTAPANIFGGGFDIRVGKGEYTRELILGAGFGHFTMSGQDQDVLGYRNFVVDGSGYFWELSAMAEFEFSSELSFLPFVSFRSAKTSETSAAIVLRSDVSNSVTIPDFDVDYTGVTLGVAIRFRVYPFETVGTPEEPPID